MSWVDAVREAGKRSQDWHDIMASMRGRADHEVIEVTVGRLRPLLEWMRYVYETERRVTKDCECMDPRCYNDAPHPRHDG